MLYAIFNDWEKIGEKEGDKMGDLGTTMLYFRNVRKIRRKWLRAVGARGGRCWLRERLGEELSCYYLQIPYTIRDWHFFCIK